MRDNFLKQTEFPLCNRIVGLFLIGLIAIANFSLILEIPVNQSLNLSSESTKSNQLKKSDTSAWNQTKFKDIQLNDSISFSLDSVSYVKEIHLNFTSKTLTGNIPYRIYT